MGNFNLRFKLQNSKFISNINIYATNLFKHSKCNSQFQITLFGFFLLSSTVTTRTELFRSHYLTILLTSRLGSFLILYWIVYISESFSKHDLSKLSQSMTSHRLQ